MHIPLMKHAQQLMHMIHTQACMTLFLLANIVLTKKEKKKNQPHDMYMQLLCGGEIALITVVYST